MIIGLQHVDKIVI